MRPAQFMAHIQFQQQASEYRVLVRDTSRLVEQMTAYPMTEEEEAENARLSRQQDRLEESWTAQHRAILAAQLGALEQVGKTVER